ncbi:MAG: hypothetical protein OJF59_001392 [Cytophagales bacterium]|jgi:hypothetical protein|nr:DUF1573 domain-containing protein [Bacteroidota bacterium]MBS1982267.1 DUF1573 domain-containing protein [Bacteroidota bacterium]WHZ07639.1 MAG: hypothetical protein OJF59_001392 [Cytophagales bacterium]
MKNLLAIAVLVFAAGKGIGQTVTAPKTDMATFAWETTTHEFGKVKQGTPVTYEFKFTNNSKVPLIITNAAPSCGCTTPSWTREPVMPGGQGHVKATYNAAAAGIFDKTITVSANIDGGIVILHIKGEVEANATPAVHPN